MVGPIWRRYFCISRAVREQSWSRCREPSWALGSPHLGDAALLRLLPDPACAHEPRSVDPPKITLVSLAAVAERAQPLQRTAPAWRTEVQCSGRRWFTDGVLAHVRTPGGPTGPAQSL